MTPTIRRQSLCLLSLVTLLCAPSLTAQAPTAPTAQQPQEALSAAWSKANAKYDGTRAKILADVDRQAHQGPFRPDWNTLSAFEVPEWFKDAKFGIFIHWACTPCPPTATSGTRARCTSRAPTSTSTRWPPTAR